MRALRFLHRKQADEELQEEIELFIAEETADNVARGMQPEEARRQARIKLGNPQNVRETLWQQNSVSLLDTIWRDLKFAVRTLIRTPGFSLVSLTVMGEPLVCLALPSSPALDSFTRRLVLHSERRVKVISWRIIRAW